MVTIKDIAREAGVSFTTVSNVIHGKTKKVSPATIEKIERIMKEMNYVPNMGARMLVRNRSRIIGVVARVHTDPAKEGAQTPFIAEILGAMEKEIRKNGCYMMVCFSDSQEEIQGLTATWNVDGVIVVSLGTAVSRALAASVKVPIVCTDCYFEEQEPYYNVGTEDEEGAYQATRYLIQEGHERIAFVADFDWEKQEERKDSGQRRVEGFRRAIREAGLYEQENSIFSGSPFMDRQREAFERLYENLDKYTGLVFCSDYLAMAGMDFLRKKGVSIPEQVSIVGFDDVDLAGFSYPRLTTVRQGVSRKGKMAVRQLIRLIDKEENVEKSVRMPVELVIRDSVSNSSAMPSMMDESCLHE